MSKNRDKPRKDRVWVCRGCCCGTKKEHPRIDHKALERQAREGAADAGVAYRVTDCLGPCEQGNVVVTRVDGTTRWFRRVNTQAATAAVLAHVRDGGDLPEQLDRHLIPGRSGTTPDS